MKNKYATLGKYIIYLKPAIEYIIIDCHKRVIKFIIIDFIRKKTNNFAIETGKSALGMPCLFRTSIFENIE